MTKKLQVDFLWNSRKNKKIKFAHGKIQCLKNVVHNLNMKNPDKLFEIIDLQLCCALKWDGM